MAEMSVLRSNTTNLHSYLNFFANKYVLWWKENICFFTKTNVNLICLGPIFTVLGIFFDDYEVNIVSLNYFRKHHQFEIFMLFNAYFQQNLRQIFEWKILFRMIVDKYKAK